MSVQVENEKSPDAFVEVALQLTPEKLEDLERVRLFLGSPNLSTSIWNANRLIDKLYQLENGGGRLSVF